MNEKNEKDLHDQKPIDKKVDNNQESLPTIDQELFSKDAEPIKSIDSEIEHVTLEQISNEKAKEEEAIVVQPIHPSSEKIAPIDRLDRRRFNSQNAVFRSIMQKNKNQNEEDSQKKLETAKKIAGQGKVIMNHYKAFEISLVKAFRIASSKVDNLLTNPKLGRYLSLFLAIMLFFIVNAGSVTNIFTVSKSGDSFTNVPVSVNYNDQIYEVSGIPSNVNVTVVGELMAISSAKIQNEYEIFVDLTGLAEGSHNVRLQYRNFPSNLKVTIEPSSVNVVLKKKITETFELSTKFINTSKKDAEYILGTPQLELQEVIIKASKDTLDSIASVEVLIDVTGVTETFENEFEIAAFNQKGERVSNIDIIPNTVKVKVPVTSPNKTVPIVIVPSGKVGEGLAIDTISLDYGETTIYGTEEELAKIDKIEISLEVAGLTAASNKRVAQITLPSGIKKSSISKVNIDIALVTATTKTITDIPIRFRNNINHLTPTIDSAADAVVTLELTGAESRLAGIDAGNIEAYIDMIDSVVGNAEMQIYIVLPDSTVAYKFTSAEKILVNITQ